MMNQRDSVERHLMNDLKAKIQELALLVKDDKGVQMIVGITCMETDSFYFGVIYKEDHNTIYTKKGSVHGVCIETLELLGHTTIENLFIRDIRDNGKKYKYAKSEYFDLNPRSFSTIK